jgi:hypothetical protein
MPNNTRPFFVGVTSYTLLFDITVKAKQRYGLPTREVQT